MDEGRIAADGKTEVILDNIELLKAHGLAR
jgi:hypothetical protein